MTDTELQQTPPPAKSFSVKRIFLLLLIIFAAGFVVNGSTMLLRHIVNLPAIDAEKKTQSDYHCREGFAILKRGGGGGPFGQLFLVNSVAQHFSQAITLNPENAEAFGGRALVYTLADKPEQAKSNFARAFQLDSENALLYSLRGFSRMKSEDYAGSIDDYTKALELKPGTIILDSESVMYNNRGYSRFHLKDFDGAIEDYREALRLDGENQPALVNLLVIHLLRKEAAEAMAVFKRIEELGDPPTWRLILSESKRHAEELDLSPPDDELIEELSRLYEQENAGDEVAEEEEEP